MNASDATTQDIVDVIVVGGGLVGGLTALLLAKEGIKPIVLDAAPVLDENTYLQKRDPRVLALSPATIHLLERVGMWAHIKRQCNYTGMEVWIRDGFGSMTLGSAEQSKPIVEASPLLGCMVEPSVLTVAMQTQLAAVLNDSKQTAYRRGIKVTALERYSNYWQLTLSNGEILKTKLVIGADGANSSIRTMAGIEIDVFDYKQIALTCAIRTEKPHHHIARQVFLPTGPLAFLPMADINDPRIGHWHSIVWTLPEAQAEEMKALPPEALAQKISSASGYMLGSIESIESIGYFPLKARQTKHYYLSGLALVGDAAHVVHPMAGQGVNIGCLDAAVLAEELLKDAQRGIWAHDQTLARFVRTRRLPNSIMMHSMTLLGWATGDRGKFITWARNQGFAFVGRSKWLKNHMIEYAGGFNSLTGSR